MNLGDLSVIGAVTALFLFAFVGLFYLKKVLRDRLFPGRHDEDRRQAMAELLLLQTELQGRAHEEMPSTDEDV
jgi:hypothetical protein